MLANDLSLSELSGVLYYDETSPSGLRWAVSKFTGRYKAIQSTVKDAIAGYFRKEHGYFYVTVAGRTLPAHRVVYCLCKGEICPDIEVDHIDGDGANNIISNLRLVPHRVNMHNVAIRYDNTSGVKGVHLKTRTSSAGTVLCYWVATWMEEGKTRSKEFSLLRFGSEAKTMAVEWRMAQIERLNASGKGAYTERHYLTQ